MRGQPYLSLPLDITDPRIVKAFSHPLRIRIHSRLDGHVASPSEIAGEFEEPLSNVSYHVRKLRSLGLIELVGRVSHRGAIEHRYTARYHPVVSDDEWGSLPPTVKRTYMGATLGLGWADVKAAVDEGGFDRRDIHYSRTSGRLDDAAWADVAAELKRTLARLECIVRDSEERATAGGEPMPSRATVIMMHFAGPTGLLGGEQAQMDGLRTTSSAAIRAARSHRAQT